MEIILYDHYLALLETLEVDLSQVKVCIETGSHRGNGTATFASKFNKVYSIELSDDLYDYCVKTHTNSNIKFIKGASTDKLTDLVANINDPYFLFLDAHGSGGDTTFDERVGRFGSPVLDEISSVSKNIPKWIVIDDLYCFDDMTLPEYPRRNEIIEAIEKIGNYELPVVIMYNEKPQWFCFKLKED
jgi:hypothetical protein